VRLATHLGYLWLPADDEVMRPYIENSGAWEPSEERLLVSLMKPDTRFLDVGANVGYFSALAAHCCPRGSLDAVEPDPRNLALLRMNLWEHAPHAKIWPVALGDAHTTVGLAVHEANFGDTRLAQGKAAATYVAALVRAEEIFPDRKFDLVKIDVQGFEAEVLLGMRGSLKRWSPVAFAVEFYPRAVRDRGMEPLDVLKIYRDLGLDQVANVEDKLLRLDDQELLGICESGGPEGYLNLVLTI